MLDRISRVELVVYQDTIAGLAVESGNAAAVTNICAAPDGRLPVTKFVVVIETRSGLRGEYAAQWGGTQAVLGQALMGAPFLLGRDPFAREGVYDDMKREFRQYDHMAQGLFDIALWDLAGKACGQSVRRLLGGYRDRLPAYASTYHAQTDGYGLNSVEAYADFATACVEMGYRCFKIHGWHDGDARREVRNLLAVRLAIGDDVALAIDPACQLRTFADALTVGLACDDVGCIWYEDPYRDSGVSAFAHRRLRERLRTPLLMTEHVRGVEPKIDFALAGGTDILRADPEYDLGITGCMKIAHAAEALGLDVEIHASGPAHRACMAAIRNTNWYEIALVGPGMPNALPPIYACGYSDQLDAIDAKGTVGVPDGSGLGVVYDWERIDRLATVRHVFE